MVLVLQITKGAGNGIVDKEQDEYIKNVLQDTYRKLETPVMDSQGNELCPGFKTRICNLTGKIRVS